MYTQEEQIIDLRRALKKCYNAMVKSEKIGCTDRLDCAEDNGDFWNNALADAQELLED